MDDADLTQARLEAEEELRARRMATTAAPIDPGPECHECGDPMPGPRRAMGYRLCRPCQEQAEYRARLVARTGVRL